jgi:hypothetical protein
MKPTQEQSAIVRAAVETSAGGGAIRVAAGAGTGKTSTLLLTADTVGKRAKPIYLAYNRAIREEASQKFGDSAAVSTLHSLAYRSMGVGKLRRSLRKPSVKEVISLLALSEQDKPTARRALQTLEQWCHSADREISNEHAPKEGTADAVAAAKALYKKLSPEKGSRRAPLPHDVYVKAWSLAGAPGLTDYGLVLLDEAQDCNPVILGALRQARAVVYVGDQHQQIYRFRGSVSAMRGMDCPEYPLTLSFRWGTAIANVANSILALKKVDPPHYLLRGDPAIDSSVGRVDSRTAHARIYRQNYNLIADAINLHRLRRNVTLVGGRESLAKLLHALEALRAGKVVRHPLVSSYADWRDLVRSLSRERGGGELSQGVRLIEEYGGAMQSVYAVLESVESADSQDTGVLYTTAHRAKGREWSQVVLGEDFQQAVAGAEGSPALDDELNLLYVAATRARHRLDVGRCPFLLEVLEGEIKR